MLYSNMVHLSKNIKKIFALIIIYIATIIKLNSEWPFSSFMSAQLNYAKLCQFLPRTRAFDTCSRYIGLIHYSDVNKINTLVSNEVATKFENVIRCKKNNVGTYKSIFLQKATIQVHKEMTNIYYSQGSKISNNDLPAITPRQSIAHPDQIASKEAF